MEEMMVQQNTQQVQKKDSSKVTEFIFSPVFAGILGGVIGATTAYIGLKAQKEAAKAADAQLKAIKLQARMGGFDKELAAEFPEEFETIELTEEEERKLKAEGKIIN